MSEARAGRYLHLLNAKLQRPSSHLRSLQTKGNSPFFPPRQLHLQIQIIKGIQQWQKHHPPTRKGHSGLRELYFRPQEVLPTGNRPRQGRLCRHKGAVQQNSRHLPKHIRGRISKVDGQVRQRYHENKANFYVSS